MGSTVYLIENLTVFFVFSSIGVIPSGSSSSLLRLCIYYGRQLRRMSQRTGDQISKFGGKVRENFNKVKFHLTLEKN